MGTAALKLLPRGVHTADYLIDGHPALIAIDSHGNCIRRVKIVPSVDEECAHEWLEGLLDHYDPLPRRPVLLIVPPSPRKWYLPRSRIVR